ncbi:MAG TPA: TIM barrel protein [Chitinophagaceae bacterium]|nr:TIM barrel protein [Chitinophagaceae bacterium]
MSISSRRLALKQIALGAAVLGVSPETLAATRPGPTDSTPPLKNRIHASACYWVYQSIPLDDFCQDLVRMGLKSIDLLKPDQWETAKKHGLYCSMCYGGDLGLYDGWNEPKNHDVLVAHYSENIPLMASYGFGNLICFSGRRRGMDDETGLQNCVTGLNRILPLAAAHGVTVVMELLNSKIDHKDYMCDHTAWGVELCKRLGSDHFKLLYDIYHMQIMEGDVIRTIRDNQAFIAHYHTGGVPGRHEIDDTQELYYPAIMRAILDTGFQGRVAQEFVPTATDNPGKLKALKRCVKICDV